MNCFTCRTSRQGSKNRAPVLALGGKASSRKIRLFACACCRRIWPLLTDERTRKAVDIAERCADGDTSDEEQFAAYESACDAKYDAWCGAYENDDFPARAAAELLTHEIDAQAVVSSSALSGENPKVCYKGEYAAQSQLLQCVFGNPFRPVLLSPAWLAWNDSIIRRIAQAIYDDRAFDRLPILADA